jgi:hypothetical protein
MRYHIDRWLIIHNTVFGEGWFSGLDRPDSGMRLSVDGCLYTPEVNVVERPDVAAAHGPAAQHWGFRLRCLLSSSLSREALGRIKLILHDRGEQLPIDVPACEARAAEAAQADAALRYFFETFHQAERPHVLEIGARARSGITRRGLFAAAARYVGYDICDGPNVDVVGDAHFLSQHFQEEFDFLYSVSTFEHLLMPWKVALEMNKVMKMGGLALVQSHQAWPIHDAPWDFYRYSKFGWHGLFNRFSGFKLVWSVHADPATILASTQTDNPITLLDLQAGYLTSLCIAQKIDRTVLAWDADPASIVNEVYPG